MEKSLTNMTGKAAAALLIVLIAASNIFGQSQVLEKIKKQKYAVENIVAGIKSENEGVKRSCIYFAGKYKIPETVETLIDLLDNEENPNTRVLVALVLYKIGTPDGLDAINRLSKEDNDKYVRRMSQAIYNAYSLESLQASLNWLMTIFYNFSSGNDLINIYI